METIKIKGAAQNALLTVYFVIFYFYTVYYDSCWLHMHAEIRCNLCKCCMVRVMNAFSFPSVLFCISLPGWRTLSSSFGGKRKSSSIFIKEACLVMLKCSAHTHTFLLIEMSAFYFKFDPFIYTFFICIISSGSWHHTLGIPALAYNSTVRTFG